MIRIYKKKKRDSNIEKQTITTGLLSKSNKIIRNSDIQNKKHLLHNEALRKCDFSWRINLHISLPCNKCIVLQTVESFIFL